MNTSEKQSLLFQPSADVRPIRAGSCEHPASFQQLETNLFTRAQDVVCGICHATLAPDYRP